MKKIMKSVLFFIMGVFLFSCNKDADKAASSSGFSSTDINGRWKNIPSGLVIEISSSTGYGKVITCGTAFPAGAQGGNALTNVVKKSGGYWEAYSRTYYPATSTKAAYWTSPGTIIGMAMKSDKKTYNVGTAVYTKQ